MSGLTRIAEIGTHQLIVVANKEEIMYDDAIIKIKHYDLREVAIILAQANIKFEVFPQGNTEDWLPSDWESSSC